MRLALALVLIASAVVRAEPAPDVITGEARQHFDRGAASYAAGDYVTAVAEFEAGRRLDPNPDFLYGLAQAYRKQGDCTNAAVQYAAFLATRPPDEEAARARANMERCPAPGPAPRTEPKVDPRTEPKVEPRTQPRIEPPRSVHPSPPREASPWYADAIGDVLASAGLLGLGIGTTYLVLGERDTRAANSATSLAKLQRFGAAADTERTVGTLCVVGGSAAAAGAVVRYVMITRGRRRADPNLSVSVQAAAVVAMWEGRF